MAKLVYSLNVSLDGYVDHMKIGPPPAELFDHFIELVRGLKGTIYGAKSYEIMRYWDEDSPEWDQGDRDFAAAWRRLPKWVVSRTLASVGPNATLLPQDFLAAIRTLKEEADGEIQVGGTVLAQTLTDAGILDEYRLYLHPIVLGSGTPYFRGPRPRLRLAASEALAGDVMRLCYVPA